MVCNTMAMKVWFLSAVILSTACLAAQSEIISESKEEAELKSVTFRYPTFTLGPGQVQNKFYYGIPFPEGHIAIREFYAEVIYEDGTSVPLSDVYLHHWIVLNYRNGNITDGSALLGNDGVCPDRVLSQLYGLGSETRHTNTSLPSPYGVEVGVYDDEAWFLNLHAIDTRGTVDPSGCIECRCDLYNVTVDEYGRDIGDDYLGGLLCCYDSTQCLLKDGYVGDNQTMYLQYTVRYVDWDDTIVPVKTYIMDVTYEGTACMIEYNVPACTNANNSSCVHTQLASMEIPTGGDVIYAVAHQHAGGIGAAIYGQDGREICSSIPLYGTGSEAGNEAGYIVGMTSCYPEPGSIQVSSNETLHVHSNYSQSTSHTGVMGLAYIVVAPESQVSVRM